jgi:hypothetical protein
MDKKTKKDFLNINIYFTMRMWDKYLNTLFEMNYGGFISVGLN